MKDFNVSFMTRLGRVTLSSRELAKKAQGSVVLDCGKTKMLITVCCLATHDTHQHGISIKGIAKQEPCPRRINK